MKTTILGLILAVLCTAAHAQRRQNESGNADGGIDPASEYAKGMRALQSSHYADAEVAFQNVVSVAPRNSDGWSGLGMAREGVGDFWGARTAFEKAIKLKPDNPRYHAALGIALVKSRDREGAQQQLQYLKSRQDYCDECHRLVNQLASAMGQ